jgi:tRNA A-37 threonylcarbamoyl transferase component Bud32
MDQATEASEATPRVATASAPADRASVEAVAAAFPHLEIVECIGQGGMGVVYRARQPKLDRFVALKVLPQVAANDPAFRERFTREGRVLARLNHPSVVTVYDFGEAGGFFYLLMEYVDGANLRQAMRAGRFSPAQALEIVPKICEALQYAHSEGVLHRDIKPENILLDTRGRVKIADFGIAKLVGEGKPGATLTATGAAVGTPQYMAPEQLERPQEVDHRADIYSLGVVFYEMLTGELPLGRFAPPSAKTPVDTRVDAVVFRTLEKEREKRFQSAGEVKTEVEGLVASGAGASPAAAVPQPDATVAVAPLRIRPEHRPLVLIGLAAVLALLIPHLLPLPALTITMVAAAFRAGVMSTLWTAFLLAAGGWLIRAAWTNRRRLLQPLGISGAELNECDTAPPWASHRVLGTLATVVLMALTVDFAFQVFALSLALSGFAAGFGWQSVIALPIAGLAAWWLVRPGRNPTPCAMRTPPPAWQRRAGLLFLVLGGVAFLPWLAAHEPGLQQWQLGALLAFTGLALLTRSRVWRAVALAVNTALALLGGVQVISLLFMLARPTALSGLVPAAPVIGPGLACLLAAIQLLAVVGTLTWPGLLMVSLPLALLALGWASIRAQHSSAGPGGGRDGSTGWGAWRDAEFPDSRGAGGSV